MRYLFINLLILLATTVFSQNSNLDSAEVKNAVIEFNGGQYNGYMIELNTSPDIVEEAVKERFKLQGMKPKETKDFMVFRNVIVPGIEPSKPMDAFIKVEKKSRKEKDQSIVYFIPTVPGDIPDEKLKGDAVAKSKSISAITNGGFFLTSLLPDIKQGVYDKDLAAQQALLKKEEKKLAGLLEDQSDLEKKLKKLQSDLEYNKKASERQSVVVESAREAMKTIIAKNPRQIK